MFPPIAVLRPFLCSESKEIPPLQQFSGVKYDLTAQDHNWPKKANCVTAVRQILQNRHSIDLPHLWLNDFPAILTRYFSWECRVVKQFKPGDLIFFYHTKKASLGHVAIAVDADRVFHCGYPKGPEILPFTELMTQQSTKHKEPVRDPNILLTFRDTGLYAKSHCLRKAILELRGEEAFEPLPDKVMTCLKTSEDV